MKILKIVISILIAAILVGGAVKLVKMRKAQEAKIHTALINPILVKTYQPKEQKLTLSLPYLANVKNSNEIIINSKFAGRITYVKNLGDKVKKGEVVAKIDSSDLKAKLKEINSQINSVKNKISAEKINLENLILTHQRTKKLLEVKMASIEQYQSEKSKIASLKAQIKADRNSLKALYANKKAIINNLTYTTLKSPINGVISAKMLNKDDNTFPGKPIVKITPEKGNYLLIALPKSYKEIIYKNKIYSLKPLNSTFEGLKTFKAEVKDKSLLPGERVDVNIVVFRGKATALPYNSILSIGGKNYVFIPKGNKAEVKTVHIIAQGQNLVAVKEKLDTPVILAEPDLLLKIKAGHTIKIENGEK
jgi:phage pi2 protein 07